MTADCLWCRVHALLHGSSRPSTSGTSTSIKGIRVTTKSNVYEMGLATIKSNGYQWVLQRPDRMSTKWVLQRPNRICAKCVLQRPNRRILISSRRNLISSRRCLISSRRNSTFSTNTWLFGVGFAMMIAVRAIVRDVKQNVFYIVFEFDTEVKTATESSDKTCPTMIVNRCRIIVEASVKEHVTQQVRFQPLHGFF